MSPGYAYKGAGKDDFSPKWNLEHYTDTSQPPACICGGDSKLHHNPGHVNCPDWCPRRVPG